MSEMGELLEVLRRALAKLDPQRANAAVWFFHQDLEERITEQARDELGRKELAGHAAQALGGTAVADQPVEARRSRTVAEPLDPERRQMEARREMGTDRMLKNWGFLARTPDVSTFNPAGFAYGSAGHIVSVKYVARRELRNTHRCRCVLQTFGS